MLVLCARRCKAPMRHTAMTNLTSCVSSHIDKDSRSKNGAEGRPESVTDVAGFSMTPTRRPVDTGANKLTAPVITETQQAGLQPPKYPFATPKKPSPACRSCTSSFDISVEQRLSSELERQTNSTRKDKQNAIHGHGQSQLRKRRRTARSPTHGRHEQIQRRALGSRSFVRLRWSLPLF